MCKQRCIDLRGSGKEIQQRTQLALSDAEDICNLSYMWLMHRAGCKPFKARLYQQECSPVLGSASPAWMSCSNRLEEQSSFVGAGFKTNNVFLNHSIVSFLKRIASPEALNLTPMLYQVRHFSQPGTLRPAFSRFGLHQMLSSNVSCSSFWACVLPIERTYNMVCCHLT